MQLNDFLTRFSIHQPSDDEGFPIQMKATAQQCAVMIALVEIENEINLLLCKRPNYLKHHPGQICFPGGKCEENDVSPLATALRETHEEMGFHVQQKDVIGRMKSYWTLTAHQIQPLYKL